MHLTASRSYLAVTRSIYCILLHLTISRFIPLYVTAHHGRERSAHHGRESSPPVGVCRADEGTFYTSNSHPSHSLHSSQATVPSSNQPPPTDQESPLLPQEDSLPPQEASPPLADRVAELTQQRCYAMERCVVSYHGAVAVPCT